LESQAVFFLLGFLAAMILISLALTGVYLSVRRSREKRTKIQGYLDLIPDLTEEQRNRVKQIRHDFLPRVEGIRENMRIERAELAKLLFAEPPDRIAIHAVAERIARHQSELEREVIEHIIVSV
jgi:Spy/CpxP family protein refolding chaperone